MSVLLQFIQLIWFVHADNAIARVLSNRQDGGTYATAIKEVFKKTTTDHPDFKMGSGLEEIVVDFSDAESNGFREAIGSEASHRLQCMYQINHTYKLVYHSFNYIAVSLSFFLFFFIFLFCHTNNRIMKKNK